ncbi:MAG: hypothetical protein KBS57_04300 [Alistipes sp.]|nr:hypothetical protein [Candidatus Minthomonas equi]
MKALSYFLSLTVLISFCFNSYAGEKADSLSMKVYFRKNATAIDSGYKDNRILIDRFISEIKEKISDPECRIDNIYIRSGASPEGTFDHNNYLSRQRGQNLRALLQNALCLPRDKFIIDAVGEDWASLKEIIEKRDVPDKQAILYILNRYKDYINSRPTSVIGGPKKELMDLNGGQNWYWLLWNVFPDLRSAGNDIVCRFTHTEANTPDTKGKDTLVVIHKYVISIDTLMTPAAKNVKLDIAVGEGSDQKDSVQVIYGDPLLDASFAPKVEINMPEGKKASVEVDNKVIIPKEK